jgi:hypothetical protein
MALPLSAPSQLRCAPGFGRIRLGVEGRVMVPVAHGPFDAVSGGFRQAPVSPGRRYGRKIPGHF